MHLLSSRRCVGEHRQDQRCYRSSRHLRLRALLPAPMAPVVLTAVTTPAAATVTTAVTRVTRRSPPIGTMTTTGPPSLAAHQCPTVHESTSILGRPRDNHGQVAANRCRLLEISSLTFALSLHSSQGRNRSLCCHGNVQRKTLGFGSLT